VKLPVMAALALLLGLVSAQSVLAQAETNAQIEINFLLGYIGGSGCEFYRNGTWHDAQAAQAHLKDKYRYLIARGLVATAEDFIEKAATKSSFTGEPYQVRCNGGASVTTQIWLRKELARFRAFNKKPASSLRDPGPARTRMSYAVNASEVSVDWYLRKVSVVL
jgi:uncharacterized protein DUF5329